MSDDKTEEPTEKKLRKAREEGDVAKSADVADGVILAAGVLVLAAAGDSMVDAMRAGVQDALRFVSGPRDMETLYVTLHVIGSHVIGAILPGIGAAVLAAIVAVGAQVGVVISMKAVSFKFDAISPAAGVKKIFSLKSLLELLKMIVKGAVLMIVMWKTIEGLLPLVIGSLFQSVPQLSRLASGLMLKILGTAAALFVMFGGVDFKLQKFLYIRGKKMSKDEIKREFKQDEGDPVIKGERKRLARELATSAPPRKVSAASIMVVNPTHYAVAVRYAPDEFPLPVVIAKGMDEAAAQLRREAQIYNVPIVGNPPVARALYKVEVDEPIPDELFEAVAAILRWVDSIGLAKQSQSMQTPAA
ncbi:type III secretion system export apparatus subunit SctU [Paraburkholderia strydomiana]|uniref:type III secretion system export apparatus subunit SctU n=1 Tax=Paraburkholderia strydomiana TaxID=1245417 RepID=UPI0038BA0AAC